jgi:hypothetical protein
LNQVEIKTHGDTMIAGGHSNGTSSNFLPSIIGSKRSKSTIVEKNNQVKGNEQDKHLNNE